MSARVFREFTHDELALIHFALRMIEHHSGTTDAPAARKLANELWDGYFCDPPDHNRLSSDRMGHPV